MQPLLKNGPTLIVIGVTGFVVYTVLFPEGDSGTPRTEPRPPSSTRVVTEAPLTTERNPFQMARSVAIAANSGTLDPDRNRSKAGPDDLDSKDDSGELRALPAEDDRVLESMKLGGTFIDRREQIAVIDNKIYARGDQLRAADGSMLPYIVTEVRKDRALVRRGRRDFVIAFSDAPRAAGPARAIAAPKPADDPTSARPDTVAKFTPIEKAKKRPTVATGASDQADSSAQREMLMRLLSTLGGSGGSGSAGGNPLSGLATGSGSNSSALNSLVNPTTLGAGLDAIMGKYDNIGQGGGTGP